MTRLMNGIGKCWWRFFSFMFLCSFVKFSLSENFFFS